MSTTLTPARRLLATALSRWLPVMAIAAALLATVLARDASPWLVSTGYGESLYYGGLLIAWPLLIAASPRLCRSIRGVVRWLAAVAVVVLCARLGYRFLPLGGYDTFAKVGLYGKSILAGAGFAIAVSLVGSAEVGETRSRRITAGLTVAFLALAGVFAAGHEGGLAVGPGWRGAVAPAPDLRAPISKVLYEEHLPVAMVYAVELDSRDPVARGVFEPIVVLTYWGDGALVQRRDASTVGVDLKGAVADALPGAVDRTAAAVSAGLDRLSFRRNTTATGADAVNIAGRANIGVYRNGQQLAYYPVVDFTADLDVATATLSSVSASVPAPPPEFSVTEPEYVGASRLTTVDLGEFGYGPELRGDDRGVSLYAGEQLVWRLTLPLMNTGADGGGSKIAWARSTANGGIIFAVQRHEWREANNRGSYPGYPVSTIYYVGPR